MTVQNTTSDTLSTYRRKEIRYAKDLARFESIFHLDSARFYASFEQGQMGDEMDFFEWTGVLEMYQEVCARILQLEEEQRGEADRQS